MSPTIQIFEVESVEHFVSVVNIDAGSGLCVSVYFAMLLIGQRPAPRPSRVSPCFDVGQGVAHVVDSADVFQI